MKRSYTYLLSALVYIVGCCKAFAYIDPGTGLVLTGGLLSAVLVAASGVLGAALLFLRKRLKKCAGWRRRQGGGVKALIVLAVAIIPIYFALKSARGPIVKTTEKKRPDVVVLGIDGLDYRIMKQMMNDKELPNFEQLAERGTFVPLNPSIPPQSPAVWTTIATGGNSGEHGIFDFIRRDPLNYKLSLTIYDSQQDMLSPYSYKPVTCGRPFWLDLNEKGIRTTVIRWPLTFPAEPLDGELLAGLGVPDVTGLLSRYTYYTTDDSYKRRRTAEDKTILVEREGDRLKTFIRGPLRRGIYETKNIIVPMMIELSADGKSAELMIDGVKTKVDVNTWSPFMAAGFKSGIAGRVPAIFKVYIKSIKPEFRMYMTSLQYDPRDTKKGLSYPKDFALRLSEQIGLFYTLGMPEDTEALEDGVISDKVFLEQCRRITEERIAMFRQAFESVDGGLLAFVFDTSDRIQHMFWRNNDFDEAGNVLRAAPEIRRHYIEMDVLLGYVLHNMDKNAQLFVFSDHGFTRFDYEFDTNRWLIEHGYMVLRDEPSEDNSWGALLHLVDWSRTKAYALGFSGIYMNKAGREGQGIVTENEYVELKREIREKLLETRAASGERVFENIYFGEEIYSGPYTTSAPDLVVGFMPGYGISRRTAMGGAFDRRIAPNGRKWRGDHIVDPKFVPGIFFSSEKMEIEHVEAMGIASMIVRAASGDSTD